jgi:DNA-binding Xre family transcriptional regulator
MVVRKDGDRLMLTYKPLLNVMYDRRMGKTELQKAAGISSATLARIFQGQPVSMTVLDSLCSALGVQPNEVIRWEPDPEPPIVKPRRSRPEGAGRARKS